MRLRYTFEILTVALLMAAGSIMRPAPVPGCHLLSSAWSTVVSMSSPAHPVGGRG